MNIKFHTLLLKLLLTVGFSIIFIFGIKAQNQQLVDSLLEIQNKKNLPDTIRLEVLHEIAFNERNTSKRLNYAKQLIVLAEKLNNQLYLHRGYLQKGQALREKGDYSKAINSLYKAAKAAEKENYQAGFAGAYIALAGVYNANDDHKNSSHYYSRAIKILRQEQDSVNLATALLNAGDGYLNAGKLDSALLYFEESGKIFQEVEYLIGTAYNLGNMGMVHALKGEHRIAKNKMDLATVILRDMGDFYPIAVYDIYIADIYKENNDLERAIEYAQHSLKIAKEHSLKEQIRDANLKLSELYDAQNKYQQAYFHQSQYLIYRDSINSEEKIREIADMRTEYEVNQREAEIQLLKTEQENQYIIFASMAVIILLLGILSILYYRNSRKKQKLNSLLQERKEEIEAQRDQLEAINATREKFLSIIAHDLMGPVNSFKGLSVIMKDSIEKEDKKDLLDIHRIFDKTITNLSTLLTNLLDWSVTQQGNIPYNPEKINLQQLSEELLDLFFNTAENKQTKLRLEITDDYEIWADANSVKTIFRNLVSNALKFTDEGGTIQLSAQKSGQFIAIKVQDTGMGMSPQKIDIILAEDHFERSQGTKGERGLGLGLQLVKEFTRMNGGKMEIESEINKGTTFIISLPTS
ncbi:tetratricopeptide repeat-containing sensor histidine kinase [Marivirga sp.]|uniref:tetratricopeptide repeat-containing sensor histidine kinase n=1 Tax=Marivirga sp. TaxID=2018662 RepID=UPI002D7F86C1|nr:ATP-binding protein [Marivirga sp.]HET8858904.1 ATP-binding protein [Marivirga sp.]